MSYNVAASSLSPEQFVVEVKFVVMLANEIFMPLIRNLQGSARLQVLELLAEQYNGGFSSQLASEPEDWVQSFETWLWDIMLEQPTGGVHDEIAFKIRNQVIIPNDWLKS